MNATTTRRLFSRETEVASDIRATPETLWSLLTNAALYPWWNSTDQSFNQIAADLKKRAKSMTGGAS